MGLPGNHNKIPQKRSNEGDQRKSPAMATSGVGWADSVHDAEARGIGRIRTLNS
jgi:hypothetical protein